MLTIQNRDKIISRHIQFKDITWYVYLIEDCVNWDLNTKENYPFYNIVLKNYIDNNKINVELKRDKVTDDFNMSKFNWYKVSCVRDMREHVQYISYVALKDIDRLLESIKIVIEEN